MGCYNKLAFIICYRISYKILEIQNFQFIFQNLKKKKMCEVGIFANLKKTELIGIPHWLA